MFVNFNLDILKSAVKDRPEIDRRKLRRESYVMATTITSSNVNTSDHSSGLLEKSNLIYYCEPTFAINERNDDNNVNDDDDNDDEVFVENSCNDFYNFSKLKEVYEARLNSYPSPSGAFRHHSSFNNDGAEFDTRPEPGSFSASNFKSAFHSDCSTSSKSANLFSTRLQQDASVDKSCLWPGTSLSHEMQHCSNRQFPAKTTRLVHEGGLFYKEVHRRNRVSHQEGKKGRDHDCWKQCWAVLRENHVLYLFKERPINLSYEFETRPDDNNDDDDDESSSAGDDDREIVDVDACIADVAYEYCKVYKSCSVFRIITQKQTEHLFKAESTCDMLKWLENLQRSNNLENNPNGLTNSMALIIKRYEAHSIAVSPSTSSSSSSKSKKPSFFTKNSVNNKAKETVSNNGCVFNETIPNGVTAKQCSSSSSSSVEKQNENTPVVKQKKWRKVRKHGSCPSDSTTPPSIPQSPMGTVSLNPDAVFGQPLERCPTGDNDYVPLIVQLCIKVVERHGLKVVGVYRIPGNTANVNALIASLDKGFENADFNDHRWKDVNVVSSLVKAFFRKLPDSLLTDKLYQQFIDANRIEEHCARLKLMRSLIEKLPKVNYETLKYLMMHLKKVVSYSHVNKMQARNLALMFGPSLLRMNNDSMATMVYHMSDQCQIVESLILYCDWLFCSDWTGDASLPPPPMHLPVDSSYAKTETGAISTDLNDSLNKDFDKTKDNSKKLCKARPTFTDSMTTGEQSMITTTTTTTTESFSKNSPLVSSFPPTSGRARLAFDSSAYYNERNIDDEIENRRKVCENLITMETNLNLLRSSNNNSTNKDHHRPEYCRGGLDLSRMVEEIRRARQEHINNARRNFIAGDSVPISDDSSSTCTTTETLAKMDCLLRHSRHLNVNPNSLDVFSPETREKIRRFQNDNRLLRRSNAVWREVRNGSDNDRTHNINGGDNSSVTSDYSTTSSNVNVSSYCGNGAPKAAPGVTSDYSSGASPITPHRQKYHLSNGFRKLSRSGNKPMYYGTGQQQRSDIDYRNGGSQERSYRSRIAEALSETSRISSNNANLIPWYRSDDDDADDDDEKCPGAFIDVNGNTAIGRSSADPNDSKKNRNSGAGSRSMQTVKPKQCRSQSISGENRRHSDDEHGCRVTPVYRSDSVHFYNCEQQQSPDDMQQILSVQRKQSKAQKLKVWFKESFRRSSPDLVTSDTDEGLVTKV